MAKQRTVPDLFTKSKQDWLREARATAVELLKYRDSITIEDVLQKCPLPRYLHRNTIGSVFKDRETFRSLGFVPSRRKVSHGRMVMQWALRVEPQPKRRKFMVVE